MTFWGFVRFPVWAFVIWTAAAQVGFAQQAADTTPKPVKFEVISIRKSKSEVPSGQGITADGFQATGVPVFLLVSIAYQFSDIDRLRGLEPWCFSDRYDIQAKVSDADVSRWAALGFGPKAVALQALLEDRFNMRSHREVKEGRIYELVVGKDGPKFQTASPGETQSGFGHSQSMDSLASFLPSLGVSRPVVNKTGLAGKYDFRLTIPQDSSSPAEVTILEALREELGLDLRSAKGPVEIFVVDRIEQPSAN